MNKEYPEDKLTGKIIGIAFDLFNELGRGYAEKIYQNGFESKLQKAGLKFSRENYCKLELDGNKIGHFFVDFVVENEVVVELKARGEIMKKDIAQVLNYLKVKGIKVGLILLFSRNEVKIKRLVL